MTLERGVRIKVSDDPDDRVFKVAAIRPHWKDPDIQVLRVSWVEIDGLHLGDLELSDDSTITMV